MLFVRLAHLMASRRLKIADVCKDTDISRPTLTALYYGTGKGINFDTIDKLCSYFRCQTNDLLYFYDVEIDTIEITYFEKSVIQQDENGNWSIGNKRSWKPLCEGEIRFKSSSFSINRVEFRLYYFTEDSFNKGYESVITFCLDDVDFPYLPKDLQDYFSSAVYNAVKKRIYEDHPNLFDDVTLRYNVNFAIK